MKTILPNGTRYINYTEWDQTLNSNYDYARYGLLKHIMSKTITNTDNSITKLFLFFYEESIIFIMKYVDRLKHFKDIHWKNR